MRVGIDVRVLARGTHTGIEEYTRGLLEALIPCDPSVEYQLFYNAYSKVPLNESWVCNPNVSVYSSSIPNRFLDGSTRILNEPKINRLLGGVDVFFSPHFLLTPLTPSLPRILVIHDLSFYFHPEFFSFRKRIWHASMSPEAQARKAARLIAVSDATARDLQYAYHIPPERIVTVLSGISPFPTDSSDETHEYRMKEVRQRYNIPETFFLYFGTIEPRKNIIGLVRAFEKVRTLPKLRHWKLVLAGSLGWSYKPILGAIQNSPAKCDIILTDFIRKEDKPFLYRLSSCFIYPSFFEGFGFPPLEAMQCGVPTITSHVTSLPEVVGNAAILIDPYRIDEIATAMEMVATSEKLRTMLRERGKQQAEKFSWQISARCVLKILREASP